MGYLSSKWVTYPNKLDFRFSFSQGYILVHTSYNVEFMQLEKERENVDFMQLVN